MKKVLLTMSVVASLALVSACASTGETSEAAGASDNKAQFDKTIKDAETAFKAVDQLGGGWAYTEEMMDDAKKAAAANDYDKALKLAKEAYDQSVMAKQQYEGQLNAGPTLF